MKTANHIPFQRERRAGHALRSFRGALSTPRGRQLAQNAVLLAVAVLALLALTLTEQFRAPQEDAVAGGADAAPPSEGGALPVLSIVTENGRLPNGEDLSARLTLLLPDGTEFQTISTRIEINERGNTSRRFPKKSYRVKIVDEEGQKQDLSIAGLRSDDDWILNPLYTDTSKIREALAYDLWARMNSSGQAAAGSRMRYAEIYFNGQYWGLYGVQERMDRKQVDADKRGGVLYKVAANDRPDEDVQGLSTALDMLRVAYPDFHIELSERTPEQAMRAALAEDLRDALDACKINASQENFQRLAATMIAAPLFFPAQRPEGEAAPADGQQQLQFGKGRTDDGRTFFCAFTDRARLLQWRNMGSVELGVKDYAPLVLSSNDTGIIIDPGVGSGLALTREMLQTLKAQLEFFDQMRNTANYAYMSWDAVAEAARNITAADEPEGRNRKERRWFGKKKK